MIRKGLAGTIGLLTLLVVGSGCTSSDEPSVSEPEVTIVPVADLATLSLPLDPYRVSQDRAQLLSQAFEELFMRCMRRLGFTQEPAGPEPGVWTPAGKERLYGLADDQIAQMWGYHPPDTQEGEPDASRAAPEPPAAWFAAADGTGPQTLKGQEVPDGGCRGEANRRLAEGAPEVDTALPDRLDGDTFAQAEQDSRVQAAFAAWSECMRSAGFEYRTPWDAVNDPQWWQSETPTTSEIAVATADVRCKEEVGLIAIWSSVHSAYQRLAIELHAEPLALILEYREIEERNAIEALEDS